MPRAATAFFLGGTISMSGHADGVVARSGADDLVASVPQLADLDVTLDARDFRRVPSASLTVVDVLELVAAAQAVDADGVVIVQGTDTIEETSYLIDLVWRSDVPVVITGAMRNPTLPGADGPANLYAAVAVAASDDFRGLGALVVFDDEVHAARFVRKSHTTSTGTFVSPNTGPVGLLVEGRAVRLTSVPRRPVHQPALDRSAQVPLYLVGLDDDGAVASATGASCDGLVVAGLGAGHVPEPVATTLVDLAARVPVVLASRTGAGPVLSSTYGFVGSETYLLNRGLISAGLLDPLKSRVLLRVALACGYDDDAIRSAFAAAGGLTPLSSGSD